MFTCVPHVQRIARNRLAWTGVTRIQRWWELHSSSCLRSWQTAIWGTSFSDKPRQTCMYSQYPPTHPQFWLGCSWLKNPWKIMAHTFAWCNLGTSWRLGLIVHFHTFSIHHSDMTVPQGLFQSGGLRWRLFWALRSTGSVSEADAYGVWYLSDLLDRETRDLPGRETKVLCTVKWCTKRNLFTEKDARRAQIYHVSKHAVFWGVLKQTHLEEKDVCFTAFSLSKKVSFVFWTKNKLDWLYLII